MASSSLSQPFDLVDELFLGAHEEEGGLIDQFSVEAVTVDQSLDLLVGSVTDCGPLVER